MRKRAHSSTMGSAIDIGLPLQIIQISTCCPGRAPSAGDIIVDRHPPGQWQRAGVTVQTFGILGKFDGCLAPSFGSVSQVRASFNSLVPRV